MAVKHILVSGKVQGVGFRKFVQKRAKQSSLRGWVRNLGDGRVEIMARGAEEDFAKFLDWIRRGPPGSIIEAFAESTSASEVSYDSFEVVADGEMPHE